MSQLQRPTTYVRELHDITAAVQKLATLSLGETDYNLNRSKKLIRINESSRTDSKQTLFFKITRLWLYNIYKLGKYNIADALSWQDHRASS